MNEDILDLDETFSEINSENNSYDSESLDTYFNEQSNYFKENNQREMIGIRNNIQLEDSSWTEHNVCSENCGSLAGKTITDVANAKNTSPNNISTITDIGEGFVYGCYEALRALQEIGAWGGYKLAEAVAGEKIDFDPVKDTEGFGFNQGRSPDQKTVAGSLVKSGTQLAIGAGETMVAGSVMGAGKLASFAKNIFGKKVVSSIGSAATGMLSDTMSFSANEENLADVLKKLGLPTIEQIAKSEDDSFWTKKIKNSVDGLAAGIFIDFISKSAKMFYKALPKYAKPAVAVPMLASDIKKGDSE